METDSLPRILAQFRLHPPSQRAATSVRKSDWVSAIRIWAKAETDRKTAHQEAGIISTRYGIKRPGLFTIRDWLLSARKPVGLVRKYKVKPPVDITQVDSAQMVVPTRIVPKVGRPSVRLKGMRKSPRKPVVFFMINPKGGSRRSFTAGLIWNAMAEAGLPEPIVRQYGQDFTLNALIGRPKIVDTTANMTTEEKANESYRVYLSRENNPQKREEEQQKIAMSELGNTLGSHLGSWKPRKVPSYLIDLPTDIYNSEIDDLISYEFPLFRDYFRIVGIVPTTPDPASKYLAANFIRRAMQGDWLDGWIHVSYGTTRPDSSGELDRNLELLRPFAVIKPPELTDYHAANLQNLPPLSSLANMSRDEPFKNPDYGPALEYWDTILPDFVAALDAAYSQAKCSRPRQAWHLEPKHSRRKNEKA